MATGICYTQSGDTKKYEQDCVKGIKLFDWPSYTCTPSGNGVTVTSYIPIPRYTVKNILDCYINVFGVDFPFTTWGGLEGNYKTAYILNDKYNKYKDLGNLTYSYFLKRYNNAELYMYIPDIYSGVNDDKSFKIGIDAYIPYYSNIGNKNTCTISTYECEFYSYNSYACNNISNEEPPFISLSSACLDYDGIIFYNKNNNTYLIPVIQYTGPIVPWNSGFGLMTIYGNNYPYNYKNHNYAVKFMFKLVPDLSNSDMAIFDGLYDINSFNVPKNCCIYKIDVDSRSKWIIHYAPLKAAYPKNPAYHVFSGFINEINEIKISSYFYTFSRGNIKSSYVNDINPNYHHFCLTGMSNVNYREGTYAYYGGLNNFGQEFSIKTNKISYLQNNYIVEADIYSNIYNRIKHYYEPSYEGILIDILKKPNENKVSLVFSYFILNAECAE